jgi:hypothetical protein
VKVIRVGEIEYIAGGWHFTNWTWDGESGPVDLNGLVDLCLIAAAAQKKQS